MNHRDLYLCHLHIKKDYNFNDLKIYVIDLHRAQIRKNVPERWLVKDLGGFLHSTMGFGLTERDYYRFFKTYFNCSLESLSSKHTLLLKKMLTMHQRKGLRDRGGQFGDMQDDDVQDEWA